MDWSKYSSLKSSKLASLGKEKQVVREAVSEVKDSDGKVVRKAEAKQEREYIALSQKRWNAESGDAMDDSKSEYSLSQLESEKARYDADMARAKAQSDGIAAAIADDATLTISVNDNSIILISENTAGKSALFHGGYAAGTVKISDPSSIYDNADTDAKVCVYKSNNTKNITIKNSLGVSRDFKILYIGV